MSNYFDRFDGAEEEESKFSPLEMLKNVPGSAAALAGDVATAVLNPIDTAQAVGALGGSALKKGQRKVREIASGAKVEPEGEEIADAAWDAIKQRYGSVDALLKTIETDPVGIAAELLPIANAAKVPGLGLKATQKVIGRMPEKTYANALNTPYRKGTQPRMDVAATGLKENIPVTRKGLRKTERTIDDLNQEIGRMVDEATAAGTTIPSHKLFALVNDFRRTKGGVRVGAQEDLAAIDKMLMSLDDQLVGKPTLTPREVQDFKTQAYKDINYDRSAGTSIPIKEETTKNLAAAAKLAVEEKVPGVKQVNARVGDLKELEKELRKRALNEGVSKSIIDRTIKNPAMMSKIALAADRIRRGELNAVEKTLTSPEIRMALALAGRTEQAELGQNFFDQFDQNMSAGGQ